MSKVDLLQKEREAQERARQRMLVGAKRHAEWDRTDPFTMDRMLTHIANGVASIHRAANVHDEVAAGPAYYDAEGYREPRKAIGHDGKEMTYDVMSYRSVVRP